jgi:hypothetical protein
MNTISEISDDDAINDEREEIRQAINEITLEIKDKLREAGLNYPVFLIVPNSGNAITTFGTLLDPPPSDWLLVVQIVSGVISDKLGGVTLRNRELACAIATITAAELTS